MLRALTSNDVARPALIVESICQALNCLNHIGMITDFHVPAPRLCPDVHMFRGILPLPLFLMPAALRWQI